MPSVAVPLSLIGTFGAMYLLGFSLDNLSLMALTVATGFVVDDAIVMLENIKRHIEQGMPRLQAALLGAREVGFTVLAMTLSLISVFLPILLMGCLLYTSVAESLPRSTSSRSPPSAHPCPHFSSRRTERSRPHGAVDVSVPAPHCSTHS